MINQTMASGTVATSKPTLGRGRGIGVGWIGKYKPKPCRVSKDDIVNLPQCFVNANSDPPKPKLQSQTSVENLSDKIARGILSTQNSSESNGKKTVTTCIDLTGEDDFTGLDDSDDTAQRWIDSLDDTNDDIESTTTINNTETTETVMKAYKDVCYESPLTSSEQLALNCPKDEKSPVVVKPDLDEKPGLCEQVSKLSVSNDSITDEINTSRGFSDLKVSSDHKEIFLNAVGAQEFVPSWYNHPNPSQEEAGPSRLEPVPTAQEEEQTPIYPYSGIESLLELGEESIIVDVLDDVILTLKEDPGDFDRVIEQLTEHLANFVTKEETLTQVVDRLVSKALEESHFSFMSAKLAQHFAERNVKLENGVTFRKVFSTRCAIENTTALGLCKDAETLKKNVDKVLHTCLLFGELLCSMKVNGKILPIFRKVIDTFVEEFLRLGSEESMTILTSMLKLVGPELDTGRPKDIEALFDKVKDFYLDSDKSGHLSKRVKTNVWNVYKLHSRDWDRSTSPVISPKLKGEPKFFKPEYPSGNPLLGRQRSTDTTRSSPVLGRQRSTDTTRSSPIDWNEYYDGDDQELNNYLDRSGIADEEYDAFEEFLKMSGQV